MALATSRRIVFIFLVLDFYDGGVRCLPHRAEERGRQAGISTRANLAIVRHTRKKWGEKMKWPPYVVAAVTYDRAPAPSCRASGKGLFKHR